MLVPVPEESDSKWAGWRRRLQGCGFGLQCDTRGLERGCGQRNHIGSRGRGRLLSGNGVRMHVAGVETGVRIGFRGAAIVRSIIHRARHGRRGRKRARRGCRCQKQRKHQAQEDRASSANCRHRNPSRRGSRRHLRNPRATDGENWFMWGGSYRSRAATCGKRDASRVRHAASPLKHLRAEDPHVVALFRRDVDLHLAQARDDVFDVVGLEVVEVDRHAVLVHRVADLAHSLRGD